MPPLILGDPQRNLSVEKEFEGDHLSISVFHSNFGSARTICLTKVEVHKLIFNLLDIMKSNTVNNEY